MSLLSADTNQLQGFPRLVADAMTHVEACVKAAHLMGAESAGAPADPAKRTYAQADLAKALGIENAANYAGNLLPQIEANARSVATAGDWLVDLGRELGVSTLRLGNRDAIMERAAELKQDTEDAARLVALLSCLGELGLWSMGTPIATVVGRLQALASGNLVQATAPKKGRSKKAAEPEATPEPELAVSPEVPAAQRTTIPLLPWVGMEARFSYAMPDGEPKLANGLVLERREDGGVRLPTVTLPGDTLGGWRRSGDHKSLGLRLSVKRGPGFVTGPETIVLDVMEVGWDRKEGHWWASGTMGATTTTISLTGPHAPEWEAIEPGDGQAHEAPAVQPVGVADDDEWGDF